MFIKARVLAGKWCSFGQPAMKVSDGFSWPSGTELSTRPGFINWINEPVYKALQLAPSSLAVSIRIHITCKKAVERDTVYDVGREAFDHPDGDTGSTSQEDTQKSDILAFESIKIESGRPDLMTILGEEVQSVGTGKLSVSGELSTLQYTRCIF